MDEEAKGLGCEDVLFVEPTRPGYSLSVAVVQMVGNWTYGRDTSDILPLYCFDYIGGYPPFCGLVGLLHHSFVGNYVLC